MRPESKHFVVVATLALAALLFSSTAWQAWRVWQQESLGEGLVATASRAVEPRQRQVPDAALASLPLFGSSKTKATEPQQSTENLPETNLKLILRGVLAANGNFAESALIEDDRKNTAAYLVGDTLPGNAKLRSVHPERIIIERSGKLENLYFPEIDNYSGISAIAADARSSQPANAPALSQSARRQQAPAQPPNAPAAEDDDQRRAEIRQRLEQLRQRLRDGG